MALVVVGTALLQALWITVVPPFRGSDEFDHAYRAAAVAGGQWQADEVAEDGRGLLVVVPEALVRAAHAQCDSLPYTGVANCSPVEQLEDGRVSVASGAGGYHPAYYWVVGTAAEPFSGASALHAMRVASALMCLLFIGLAAWAVASRNSSTWSRVGLVVAMTPVLLYSTSVAAPNGLEMAAALAFWSSLLGLASVDDRARERVLLVVAVLSASVLMVDRVLGPLFALVALLAAWGLEPALVRRVVSRHTRLFVAGSVVVLGAATWAVAWFLRPSVPGATPSEHSGFEPSTPVLWLAQSIAAFPYRNQPGPAVVYPVWGLVFLSLLVVALRAASVRQRVVLSSCLAAGMVLPLVLTALTYSGRGAMWQGRYGLPLTVGIVLVAAHLLDARGWRTRLRPGVLLTGTILGGVATLACFVKVRDHELVRAVSATDPSWHPPNDVLLGTLTFGAWALFYLSYARESRAVA